MEAALAVIDQEAGAIDNRHRLAEIQVAMLSSSKLDTSVRTRARTQKNPGLLTCVKMLPFALHRRRS